MLVRLFFKLVLQFDLATSLFRSFELLTVKEALGDLEIKMPVLDIGCAEGYIAKEVFKEKKVFGLDYESRYLAIAKNLSVYNSVLQADAKKMPFKDNVFNFLFSNSVLEHIDKVDIVLNEAKRILKLNGLFLFTVPNRNFSLNLFFFRLLRILGMKKLAQNYTNERNRRLNHLHLYTQEEWLKIVEKCGFKIKLMKDYASGRMLALWDLIAAIQFCIRETFKVFFKIPVLKETLFLLAFLIKIFLSFILLPFFLFFENKLNNGCSTLIILSK